MTPLLGISLASLVGANGPTAAPEIVLPLVGVALFLFVVNLAQLLVTRFAMSNANDAHREATRAQEEAGHAIQRMSEAEIAVVKLEYALSNEQRLHRLLLARREAKRERKKKAPAVSVGEPEAPANSTSATMNVRFADTRFVDAPAFQPDESTLGGSSFNNTNDLRTPTTEAGAS